LSYFNCSPDKIPRNYTTISNENNAASIDRGETDMEPSRGFMHVRLYSAGSEFVHRSFYSLVEGYAVYGIVRNSSSRWVMAPGPARGTETAWWSSVIILDSHQWIMKLLNIDMDPIISELRKEVIKKIRAYKYGDLR